MRELDIAAVDRALGLRGSLHDFVRMAWPIIDTSSFVDNWHIGAKCEHLEAVSAKQIERLVINEPPGSSKSRTVCALWPAWEWIRRPETRWIFGSYAERIAIRDAKATYDLIRSKWFQQRWGDIVSAPARSGMGYYHNSAGGWRWSVSVGGPVTGNHCDIEVCDDPIKPLECTDAGLERASDWWDGTMATRFRNLSYRRRVIIMQRLHENDLAGRAIEQGYEALIIPMRYEARYNRTTSLGRYDPRTEDGELLCPARLDEEALVKLEASLGSAAAVASQLQQRPTPEDGLVFLKSWFKTYVHPPEKLDEIVQSWDASFKDLATSDWVVGQVWGRAGSQYYLLDQVRGKWDFPTTVKAILDLSRKWPRALTKLIEDKANGPAIISTLKKDVPGIIAVEPRGSKQARAASVAPLFEAGDVFHPDPAALRWVEEHQLELMQFPMSKHDDTVDTCSQALSHMSLRANNFAAAMARVRQGMK